MSFFKKLADFARKSNENFSEDCRRQDEMRGRSLDAEENYKTNANVCANCTYYRSVGSYSDDFEYGNHRCDKHLFIFDRDSEEYKEIQYHKTCNDFLRRR